MPSLDDARRYRKGSSPERRRTLRRDETEAERALWLLLRSRRLGGAKFRRQHSLGPYVADFYCTEAHLVVELDGAQHHTVEGIADDAVRTRYLEARGTRVLRVTNLEVLTEREAVLLRCWSRSPRAPSPTQWERAGGEGAPRGERERRDVGGGETTGWSVCAIGAGAIGSVECGDTDDRAPELHHAGGEQDAVSFRVEHSCRERSGNLNYGFASQDQVEPAEIPPHPGTEIVVGEKADACPDRHISQQVAAF